MKGDKVFLRSKSVAKKFIEFSNLEDEDIVLEIGAGKGFLTSEIIKKAKLVYAVEIDPNLVFFLKRKFSGAKNLAILQGDILKIRTPEFDKCVSNIPYSISSEIIELLGRKQKFSVLGVQKEFAKRMIAKPGTKNYSRLSVMSKFYFQPEYMMEINRKCFKPVPEVDSAIIRLIPNKKKIGNEALFFKLMKALFMHKKMKVRNSLIKSEKFLNFSADIKKMSENLPYGEKRPFELTLEEIFEICDYVESNIH